MKTEDKHILGTILLVVGTIFVTRLFDPLFEILKTTLSDLRSFSFSINYIDGVWKRLLDTNILYLMALTFSLAIICWGVSLMRKK